MASTNTSMIGPVTIMQLQSAIYSPMAMLAGMQLDVFTPLTDGPLTGTEVAAAIGVAPRKLMPLLYALAASGLLSVQDDRFSNTPEANMYLVRGSPSYLAGSRREFYADIWQALLKTADSIRAAAPQHKHDFYSMSEPEMAAFFRGQHFYAVAVGEYLAKTHDFSTVRQVLDVATGSGGIAIGACQTCPSLTVTAVDLAGVIPVTRQFLNESTSGDRITTAVVDVVVGSPEGTYDVAIMRNLVQVLSLEDAQAAVRNVAQSLKPGGKLFVAGSMLDDTRLAPSDLVGQNLVHLNVYDDGLIYTEGEYRSLLSESGLMDIEIQSRCLPGGSSLALARKPG
jgi:2-hydroxy-4-(methylsulfanyl)butanoate S-methyltransferase